MIEEAQHHFESGNYPAAEELYRKMLDDEPDNPEVLFMLALVRQSGLSLQLRALRSGLQPGGYRRYEHPEPARGHQE